MTSNYSPNIEELSQYHHYIPRFIIKTFTHTFRPSKSSKGARQRWKKGLYPGDPVLYTIDLGGPAPWIKEAPISRTFGSLDMYRDIAAAAHQHQHHIEQQLSGLESEAALIVRDIRKAHEKGNQGISLTRARLNTLRKFLFVMKYRGSTFHRRFFHSRTEDYTGEDTSQLKEYMCKKDYQRPIDVWLNNIKALLEVDLGADDWQQFLLDNMYPGDALWAIAHIRMYYMAICTPSAAHDEFLVTQNAYSIAEGPFSSVVDLHTGKTRDSYTEFHMFGIISPKLALVLRSLLLPDRVEDENKSIRDWRSNLYTLSANLHAYPSLANSDLEDLPVHKSRESSTRTINGRTDRSGDSASHSFYFQYFPLSTSHVDRINFVMLEECPCTSTTGFNTKDSARKTLESYLTAPVENNASVQSIKTVGDTPDDLRKAYLDKLEQAARELGANVSALYATIPTNKTPVNLKGVNVKDIQMNIQSNMVDEAFSKKPTKHIDLYKKLGGSAHTWLQDWDQGKKMLNMRIKVDVWSQGVEEDMRQKIRGDLREIFCNLLPRRVWYYLKSVRFLELGKVENDRPHGLPSTADVLTEPEDVIAEASHLFRQASLARTMYFAVLNQIYFEQNPRLDRLSRVENRGFGAAGLICKCGIPFVEDKARDILMGLFEANGFPERMMNPKWNKNQNVEMATRVLLRRSLPEILGSQLSVSDLKALDKVLFDIVYLTVS